MILNYNRIRNFVSIIIPTHNRENYIIDTLSSATKQTYNHIEIIVVDDHSIDNTIRSVETFVKNGHPNVFLYRSDGFGACHARNVGLEKSRGEYIQFFDDDDLMCPDYIERRLNILKEENLDFVSCDFEHFENTPSNIILHRRISETPHNIKGHILYMNLPTQCFLLSFSGITKMGWWNEDVKRLQDMAYFHRLFLYDLKGKYLAESLFKYRIHSNSITGKNRADSQIFAYHEIANEWKIKGKYGEIRDALDYRICASLVSLWNDDKIMFLRCTLRNLNAVVRMLFFFVPLKLELKQTPYKKENFK